MKRLMPIVLSLTLVSALVAPPVLAEVLPVDPPFQAEEVPPEEPAAGAPPAGEAGTTEPAEAGTSDENLPEEVVMTAVTGAPEPWEALDTVPEDPDESKLTHLRFADLQSVLEKNNPSIKYMKESIKDLRNVGSHNMDYTIDSIGSLNKALQEALAMVQMNMGTAPEELQPIYAALAVALNANAASVASQVGSLEGQASSLDVTAKTSRNTLENAINQVYKGAETLYLTILTLEESAKDVERTLATLDRTIAIFEKQNELGMASDFDVESMRYNRVSAASGLESLRYSIHTCKINLEGMCGFPLNGNVVLEQVSMPSPEELENVSYDRNLTEAMRKNVDVANAYAQWDEDDSDSDAPAANYEMARSSFRSGYKLLCIAVPEKERLLNTAQATVDFQERTFSIAGKKYELGMLSYEEYQSAQNDLDSAKSDLFSARMELVTAYRDYVWATTCGIV